MTEMGLNPAPVAATDDGQAKRFHIPSLDGVRAIAFLIVFTSHAGLKDVVPGGFGVTIFFVLSGYLITTLLRKEMESKGRVELGPFYIRRSLRILPPLYITISVAFALKAMGQLDGSSRAGGIISQLFNYSNFFLIYHGADSVITGTGVLWSLSVEEHFYLAFPIFYSFISKRYQPKTQGLLLAAICAACLVWRLILIVGMHRTDVRTELGTDTRFDGLLFGCLMAILLNPALDKSSWFTPRKIRVASLVSICVLLFCLLYRSDVFRFTLRYTLQGIAILPIFVYLIRIRNSFIFRLLNGKLLVEIGGLSYSLYLFHAVILDWTSLHLHASKVAVAALSAALALICSKLLQVFVERPILALRRYLVGRRSSMNSASRSSRGEKLAATRNATTLPPSR